MNTPSKTVVFVGSNARERDLVASSLPGCAVRHVRTPVEMIWTLQSEAAVDLVVFGVSCPRGLADALREFLAELAPQVRMIDAYQAVATRRPSFEAHAPG